MENQKKNEYDIQAAKSLGDELGQLRQKSGWDIDEVARRLKLSAEQIEALEKGDYSFFSGLVFVMGYLRSYARLLKIDEASITGRLKAISAPEEDHIYLVDRKQNTGLNYQDGEKVGFPKWVLGVAALILLGGGIYVWQSKSNHENEQQVAQNSDAVRNSMQTPDLKKENVAVSNMAENGKQEVSNVEKAASSVAASEVAASEPEVKVDSDELWIKVQYRSNLIITDKNGKMIFSNIVPAGSEKRFKGGAPYNVWIGIAAGAQANYGGTPIQPIQYRAAGEKSASFVAGKK